MKSEITRFPSKQRAIDYALWMNFKMPNEPPYGVVESSEGVHLVVSSKHLSFEEDEFEELPESHENMDYRHIRSIFIAKDPLDHWVQVIGMLQVQSNEVLRFILHSNVPLEKFIRFELALSGHDENGKWCGFEKAKEIWLV